MATSNPVWRWIGSSKNLLGSALAVVALGAQIVVGLGPFWPLVVAASYGVGALVAPRDKFDLRLGLGAGASAEALTEQLRLLRATTKGQSRRLEADANALVTTILDTLDQIVARWSDLDAAPDQKHVVEQMIVDYLPTSLQTFLNLPRTFAISARVEGQRTAHDELIEQLTILAKESDRIRTALYARDLDKLSDQSRFLRDKFQRSELEL